MSENPIEKLIEEYTHKVEHSRTYGSEAEVLHYSCFIKRLKSLPPMIPALQWMPEGWVPVEPGPMSWNDCDCGFGSENNEVFCGFVFQLEDGLQFSGTSADGSSCNVPVGPEGRWCPIPAAPELTAVPPPQ